MSISKRCDLFLQEMALDPAVIEMEKLCLAFLAEMERALKGEVSSLPMLATHLRSDVEIVPNQQVITMDAGGTNFRSSLVSFDQQGKAEIRAFQRRAMPGFQKEVSSQDFFATLGDEIERLFHLSDLIGFCFSYEAEVGPDYDAIALRFSKEIQAESVLGLPLGKSLLQEMSRRGYPVTSKRVVVLNDTVATLLASRVALKDQCFSSYIGFILGTGTNTAYVEAGEEIINVESGSFDLALGELDSQFFDTTQEPTVHRFEKLIGGAYLGPFAHLCLRKAVEQALLSDHFGRHFEQITTLTTAQMSDFLEPTSRSTSLLNSCVASIEDEKVLYCILNAIVERSAKLAAVNLAAIILKSDEGHQKERPICINADGTTFSKTANLRRYTEGYLEAFLQGEYQRYFTVIQVPDAPTLGTAVAALQAISTLNE